MTRLIITNIVVAFLYKIISYSYLMVLAFKLKPKNQKIDFPLSYDFDEGKKFIDFCS